MTLGVRAVQTGGDTDEGQAATVECHSESESTLEEQELPEHLRCLYEECRKRLTTEQAKFVRELLIEFADVFATHDLDIGRFTVFAHRIRTGNAMSLRKSMRRTPLGFDHEERKTLKAMLDAKVLEPSQSEWVLWLVLWYLCGKRTEAGATASISGALTLLQRATLTRCPWSRSVSTVWPICSGIVPWTWTPGTGRSP